MSEPTKPDVISINNESAAHTVLNSILTQCAVTKKSYKTKLKISYLELMKGVGDDDTYADVDLLIEISCKWDEADSSDTEISIEEDEEGGQSYE